MEDTSAQVPLMAHCTFGMRILDDWKSRYLDISNFFKFIPSCSENIWVILNILIYLTFVIRSAISSVAWNPNGGGFVYSAEKDKMVQFWIDKAEN
jgi:hypothetical protein